MPTHLSDDEIGRFLAGRLEPAGRKRVLRHLTAGCGVCSRKLVEQTPDRLLDEAQESRRRNASRDPLRTRTIAAALEQDALWRPDDKKLKRSLESLGSHPQGYDGLTFRQIQALHGKPLVEALLQRSWEARFHDPKTTRWLAYNAVKASESLDREESSPSALLDLQAHAWADLANAYKINDELSEAEAAFARARDLLRRGSGDLRLLARNAVLEASLRGTQRRYAEGRALLVKAHQLYVRLGDRHLAGRTLISQGSLRGTEGTFQEGIPLYRQGLALLDPDREPLLVAVGQQGLINNLVGCGQYQEAGRQLLKSDLRLWLPGPRVRWVEGRLLAGLGQLTKAERALTNVRKEFLEDGRANAAATVGLDLLPVLLRQGKHALIRKIALESYTVLRDLGIHRDAARVRSYFR